jgi:tetratricopeptide (TPR) repeat protein
MYFDNEKWYKALDRAEAYDWKGAMDMWISLLSTNDMLRRSCAAYNIATACYMLGEYDLAIEWLDQSDKDNKLPYSDVLRKRINERRAF